MEFRKIYKPYLKGVEIIIQNDTKNLFVIYTTENKDKEKFEIQKQFLEGVLIATRNILLVCG